MKIAVKSLKNRKVKEIELPESVFAYPYNEHLIHSAVHAHLAARRQGTHKTKQRGEVRSSGRKLYRQKGTGRARAGRASSPLRRGGGTAHGPQPRDYTTRLSAREKRNALKSALSRKLADEGLLVINSFELESHKTGEFAKTLAGLKIDGRALVVDEFGNMNLALAVRNNPQVKAVDALAVSVYDIVDRPHIVVSEEALGRLIEVLSK